MLEKDRHDPATTPPPKPPTRGEKVDDQNEEADDTDLYDRNEDVYNQDGDVLGNLGEDDEPDEPRRESK